MDKKNGDFTREQERHSKECVKDKPHSTISSWGEGSEEFSVDGRDEITGEEESSILIS